MTAELAWPVIRRFRHYLDGLPDGQTRADIESRGDDFLFPLVAESTGRERILQFGGRVHFTGHGGMLSVDIARPALHIEAGHVTLTIDDPWDEGLGGRVVFAEGTIANFGDMVITIGELRLTEDACDLFNGAYEPGASVDGVVVTRGPSTGSDGA